MNKIQQVLALREAGYVQRCHTMIYMGAYNNAMHSYGVASLLFMLHPKPVPSALIEAALFHDAHERWTGDIPSPAMWISKELDAAQDLLAMKVEQKIGILQEVLTEEEYSWLKGCDYLELFLWVSEQTQLGNKTIVPMLRLMIIELTRRRDEGKLPEPIVDFFNNFMWERLPDADELLK